MTTLKKISGPYTSISVAAYQPLFIRWISSVGLQSLVSRLVGRIQLVPTLREPREEERRLLTTSAYLDPWVEAVSHFNMRESSNDIHSTEPPDVASIDSARSIFRALLKDRAKARISPDTLGIREVQFSDISGKPIEIDITLEGGQALRVPIFWPGISVVESLSPIGLLYVYRHYYFNGEEGVGPIEQALTLAPHESVEIVLQTTRRTTLDEQRESTQEAESNTEMESRASDEISDRVASMIERSRATTVSVEGGGSIGVFEAKGSVTTTQTDTSRNTREQSTRTVKELTTRVSERLKKSFSIRTRTLQEYSATNTSRRTINNPSEDAVNFGLRRVFRPVQVKVQDLGPRLVWQVMIRSPGAELGQATFLDHRQIEEPVFQVERPKSGEDEIITAGIIFSGIPEGVLNQQFTLSVPKERRVKRVAVIGSVLNAGRHGSFPGGNAPFYIKVSETPLSQSPEGLLTLTVTGSTRVGIGYWVGVSISFHLRYSYDPTDVANEEWDKQKGKWQEEVLGPFLDKQLDLRKVFLQRRAKVEARPSDDLRREERFELMKLISRDVLKTSIGSGATEMEVEGFARFFDVESMFHFCHPSWWKPRNLTRTDYEIAEEMPSAKFGSSIGWLLQLDGDRMRNEFLNSPFVRVCVPINAGLEREAIAWLAEHAEGTFGLTSNKGKLNAFAENLLTDLEKIFLASRYWRAKEPAEIAHDKVTEEWLKDLRPWLARVAAVDDAASEGGRKLIWVEPRGENDDVDSNGCAIVPFGEIFPLYQQYDTTIPVDGFVYESLDLRT